MNDLEKELDIYVKSVLLLCTFASQKKREDWAFGAIDIAHRAGIINNDEAEKFYQKYELL